jgi:hypothetical protein
LSLKGFLAQWLTAPRGSRHIPCREIESPALLAKENRAENDEAMDKHNPALGGARVAHRNAPVTCACCGRKVKRQMRGQRYCSKRCRQRASREKLAADEPKKSARYPYSGDATTPQKSVSDIKALQAAKTRLSSRATGPLNILGGGSFRWPNTPALDAKLREAILYREIGRVDGGLTSSNLVRRDGSIGVGMPMSAEPESDIKERFKRTIERRNRAIGTQRIGDLNELFASRYGGNRESYVFPNDDAGLEDLKILLHHYALNNPLAMTRIIRLRAPWLRDASSLLPQIDAFPTRWRAGTLGRLLNLSGAEWRALRLRTIGPVDMTKMERVAYSQALARERKKAKRRAEGRLLREEWLARNSLSRTKPWVAEGVSRRTWERRRAVTQVRHDKDCLMERHTCVSGGGAESQRKWVAERRPSKTAAAKVHPSVSSGKLAIAPAWKDLSQAVGFLTQAEAEWLVQPTMHCERTF